MKVNDTNGEVAFAKVKGGQNYYLKVKDTDDKLDQEEG